MYDQHKRTDRQHQGKVLCPSTLLYPKYTARHSMAQRSTAWHAQHSTAQHSHEGYSAMTSLLLDSRSIITPSTSLRPDVADFSLSKLCSHKSAGRYPLSILSKGNNCLDLMLSFLHELVRTALLTCRHVTARSRTPGPPLSKGIVANRPGTLPVTSHTRTRPSSCPVKYKSLLPGAWACRLGSAAP